MTLKNRISTDERRKALKLILESKGFLRIIEAHNGLSAIIANNIKEDINGETSEFDGFWESSLTDSASKGYPDIEIIGPESRYETIRQIFNGTNKPLIVDGDTGGEATNFEYFVRSLEDLGVSMVIIEDKQFPKRNSLEAGTIQAQENPEVFATKIKRGKESQLFPEFMIVARIESLISGAGLEDAIYRAKKYLQAGADGIMIHSKSNNPTEILAFAKQYDKLTKELGNRKPLVCVPTTYNTITEDELKDNGFNIVIYANHLLRSAHKAMYETALSILRNKRGFEAEPLCSPVKSIFKDVGFLEIKEKDLKFARTSTKVIIPAAGKSLDFDCPKSMIKVKGKTILQRQVDVLSNLGLRDITVIRGYKKESFDVDGVKHIDNDEFEDYFILHSLFKAVEQMLQGFIYINSDIIFNEQIIRNLIETKGDIVLVLDNSYTFHKHDEDKKLDLVLTKNKPKDEIKRINQKNNEILRIGKNINKDMADFEFIGIAYFSEYGVDIIKKVYEDLKSNHNGPFHEAASLKMASFTDFIQEIIDRGFRVEISEVHKGWIEIHDKKDVEVAEGLL